MLQLLALLILNWLLLQLIEKKNLSVLGLIPDRRRLLFFFILLLLTGAMSASTFLWRMYFLGESYVPTPGLTATGIFQGCWYQLRSVATEELMFRGALLYILLSRTGSRTAVLVSSLLFSAAHGLMVGGWNFNMQLILLFTFTFLMGLVLAYACIRSGSLLLPLAIHLGWNLVQNYVFPDGGRDVRLLMTASPPQEVVVSYAAFFSMLFLPKICALLSAWLVIRQYPLVSSISRQVE